MTEKNDLVENDYVFGEEEGEISKGQYDLTGLPDIDMSEQDLVEKNDARRLFARVNEVLAKEYAERVNVTTWTEKAVEELDEAVEAICRKKLKENRDNVIRHIQYLVASNIYGVRILQPLMDDKNVTEIECLAHDKIYYVDFEGRKLSDIKFEDREDFMNFATSLTDKSGLSLSPERPIADFPLPNKTRVNITGPWVTTSKEPVITMRKPPTAVRRVTKEELMEWGSFTRDMYDLMELSSKAKLNITISGETGSGKTTIIRMIMDFLRGTSEKIILMQDTPEIDPEDPGFPLVLLQTINRKENPIDFFELLRSTLRMNPDRTWIGEIRGKEAAEMIESNMAGARGTLATMHSDSPRNMIKRLIILMYRAGFNFETQLIREIIHSSVDMVYQTQIMPDGSKKITEIAEIIPLDEAEREGIEPIRTIYAYRLHDVQEDANGKIIKVLGEHVKENDLSVYRRRKMLSYGVRTPEKFGGVPAWK